MLKEVLKMVTGYFIRGAHGDTMEVDRMSDEQLDELAKSQPDRGWQWAKALAGWIRDNISEEVVTDAERMV